MQYLQVSDIGKLEVEKDSVYGVAITLPQVARSCGWPPELMSLAVRNFLVLFFNVIVQIFIIFMLDKEDLIMNKFSGRMYTCNMGANMPVCPDGPRCTGPSGTKYTPSRLYNFDTWMTRSYVQAAFRDLFPHMREEIDSKVDPGEFGVESSECRYVCVFIFVISLMSELEGCWNLGRLLWHTPTCPESWVRYEVPSWAPKETVKKVTQVDELDFVKLQVAGMARKWKIFNAMFVLAPKVVIWASMLMAGTNFLMETSGINNIIVNSTALGFVLCIDELCFELLTSAMDRIIVERTEGLPLFELNDEDDDEAVINMHFENTHRCRIKTVIISIFHMVPFNFWVAFGLWAALMFHYYYSRCHLTADGQWVSDEMYLPKDTRLTLLQAWMPGWFPYEMESDPYWEMPDPS